MKQLLRKWARWFFKSQVKIYHVSKSISHLEGMNMNPRLLTAIKFDMVHRIAERMYDEGLIEFTEESDFITLGRYYEAKIRVI
jgi:hypothetical protein